jgi:protein-tyrosine phosphatase
MKSVLFVCLGNICRSPLADGIAKNYAKEHNLDIEIDSCGTGDWHLGEAPCDNSIKVGKLHNIDISNLRARQVTKNDFNKFEKIIALDDSNYENLLKLGCPKEKLSKLGFYGYDNKDVVDPYYFKGFEGFEKVYEMIDECVRNLLLDP